MTSLDVRSLERTDLASVVPLLAEVNDLKRVRIAGGPASLAVTAFRTAWAALCGGDDVGEVARARTVAALAATRLGGVDAPLLIDLGLSVEEATAVVDRALVDALSTTGPWGDHLGGLLPAGDNGGSSAPPSLPPFVDLLADQPRAGATCPGKARLVLQPPENHAEHCVTVAVYAVLLAPLYDADPAVAFLAGLAHHLHNARLPDGGFTGEELLGPALAPLVRRLTDEALDQLPAALRVATADALAVLPDATSPEGRAFHAADVLDRVLEVRHHAVAAAFTLDQALGDLQLVHAGPVQAFHLDVLAGAGLWV